MEITYHIKAVFRCVYLLNGAFVEKADNFTYSGDEPLYITVLPLNAHHLPYTVKVSGFGALSNEHLISIYRLPENNCYIKLAARYNYVYSTEHRETPDKLGFVEGFFLDVRHGNLVSARAKMTDNLSKTIDDTALRAFFDDYTDIIENTVGKKLPDSYFLIDKSDKGVLFRFEIKDGLIDDIIQI